jgi:hypothetical protein
LVTDEENVEAENVAKTKELTEDTAADEKIMRDMAKRYREGKAAEASKPDTGQKKPIKFKDAVGRKFSFPFELCSTWAVS